MTLPNTWKRIGNLWWESKCLGHVVWLRWFGKGRPIHVSIDKGEWRTFNPGLSLSEAKSTAWVYAASKLKE